jgi:hypothetical protein
MKIIIAITIAALVFVGFLSFISRLFDKADQHEDMKQQAWQAFSMQHHCQIVRNPTFANPTTTWRCDGNFEVVR